MRASIAIYGLILVAAPGLAGERVLVVDRALGADRVEGVATSLRFTTGAVLVLEAEPGSDVSGGDGGIRHELTIAANTDWRLTVEARLAGCVELAPGVPRAVARRSDRVVLAAGRATRPRRLVATFRPGACRFPADGLELVLSSVEGVGGAGAGVARTLPAPDSSTREVAR